MKERRTKKRPKICFMGLTGYQLLKGGSPTAAVGPDVYQTLLARELLKHGYQVAYINYDEGGPTTETLEGIEVIKTYPIVNRLNLIQKAVAIGRAMRQANADIYFQQGGAGPFTPLFCRLTGRKCVVSIGHDAYVDSKLRREIGWLARFKTALEIRLAHVLLVLSEYQQTMLKDNFSRDSMIARIHLPLPVPGLPEKAKPLVVLWVGSISERKQPELFLELARAIPEAFFQLIGGSTVRDYVNKIAHQAEAIPNIEYLGFVPFDEINQYFSRASVFVSTSTSEGFPNVFIQAWMNYTPVVSLNVDPDGVIERCRLGFHSGAFDQMVKDVRSLLADEQLRQQMGENCRKYAEENHDIKEVVKKHIKIFNDLTEANKC